MRSRAALVKCPGRDCRPAAASGWDDLLLGSVAKQTHESRKWSNLAARQPRVGTVMDDLLADHDDPEKRIAALEQRHGAPAARRFEATVAPPSTKQMMKYTYLLIF